MRMNGVCLCVTLSLPSYHPSGFGRITASQLVLVSTSLHLSKPGPPSILSLLPSPNTKSSPGPPERLLLPRSPKRRSFPGPPTSESSPMPPLIISSPSSPQIRSFPSSPSILSLPPSAAITSLSGVPTRLSSPEVPTIVAVSPSQVADGAVFALSVLSAHTLTTPTTGEDSRSNVVATVITSAVTVVM